MLDSAASLRLSDIKMFARRDDTTSCGAADSTKPKARLCEPWVNRTIGFGAAERRLKHLHMNSIAAPRLQIIHADLPKARRLALGLVLSAAPQLVVSSRLEQTFNDCHTRTRCGVKYVNTA